MEMRLIMFTGDLLNNASLRTSSALSRSLFFSIKPHDCILRRSHCICTPIDRRVDEEWF